MAASKPSSTAPGLKLPKRVWRGFAEAGIFAPTNVSLQHQQLAHRYVIRGVEAGGAVAELGHYVTFAGADGEPLEYLHPLDSVGANGVHAVVVAPVLARIEVFRSGHTYQVLISRHYAGKAPNGRRPGLETEVIFRSLEGHLEAELWGREKSQAGSLLPRFYTAGGELREIPAAFQAALLRAVKGACCIACRHCHYLVAVPRSADDREERSDPVASNFNSHVQHVAQ